MPCRMYSIVHLSKIIRLSDLKSPLFYPSSQVGRVPIPTRGHTLWYSLYIRTLWRNRKQCRLCMLAHYQQSVILKQVGVESATRPGAARTHRFRLINTQNRALRAPLPSLYYCHPTKFSYVVCVQQSTDNRSLGKNPRTNKKKLFKHRQT